MLIQFVLYCVFLLIFSRVDRYEDDTPLDCCALALDSVLLLYLIVKFLAKNLHKWKPSMHFNRLSHESWSLRLKHIFSKFIKFQVN